MEEGGWRFLVIGIVVGCRHIWSGVVSVLKILEREDFLLHIPLLSV